MQRKKTEVNGRVVWSTSTDQNDMYQHQGVKDQHEQLHHDEEWSKAVSKTARKWWDR